MGQHHLRKHRAPLRGHSTVSTYETEPVTYQRASTWVLRVVSCLQCPWCPRRTSIPRVFNFRSCPLQPGLLTWGWAAGHAGTRLPRMTSWLWLPPGGLALWVPFLPGTTPALGSKAKETLTLTLTPTPGATLWTLPDLCLFLQENLWLRSDFCLASLVIDGSVMRALSFSLFPLNQKGRTPISRPPPAPWKHGHPSFCLCRGRGDSTVVVVARASGSLGTGTVGCLSGWRQACGASPRRKTNGAREEETRQSAFWRLVRSPRDWGLWTHTPSSPALQAGRPRPACWQTHCLGHGRSSSLSLHRRRDRELRGGPLYEGSSLMSSSPANTITLGGRFQPMNLGGDTATQSLLFKRLIL